MSETQEAPYYNLVCDLHSYRAARAVVMGTDGDQAPADRLIAAAAEAIERLTARLNGDDDDTGPSVAERLDHALRLLAASRAREAAVGPLIRDAVARAADERERAVRAEQECARLTALLAEARQPLPNEPCGDPVVERMVALLRQRASRGLAKYGTTLARLDLELADWLTHALEETADATLYLLRARDAAREDGLAERGA